VLLLYLGRGFDAFRRLSVPSALEPAEAVGAGAYVAIGLAGLVASGAFLANVLGLGQPGVLLSGGIVAPLNIAVGLEVAGGVLLLLDELLAQWIVVRRRNDR
jgi:multicomponent Na+:H+ antiporter subunit B